MSHFPVVKTEGTSISVGIDGCKLGWFVVAIDQENQWEVNLFSSIGEVWEYYSQSALLLLDMPIGLKEEGDEERRCDRLARKYLAARSASVFPVPCRAAIYAETYEVANQINRQKTNKGLSLQAWYISPKIKEVDQFLRVTPAAQGRIHEAHPELGFWTLQGSAMEYNKKSILGFDERMRVLQHSYPLAQEVVNYTLKKFLRKEVAKDDLLDALCLAINGRFGLVSGFESLPASPEIDAKGLEMKIVFGKRET